MLQSSRVSSCKETTRAHKCRKVAIGLHLVLEERLISCSRVAPEQTFETPNCCYRHMGSDAILCNCTPGFTGRRCEVPLLDPRDTAGEYFVGRQRPAPTHTRLQTAYH